MIPKIIHYCWFGGSPIPKKDQYYIDSWKKYCPDYQIIKWNESNYDIGKNQYMKEAYSSRKWGFVPDYARYDIIYNNGGIYLDTDVEMIKPLDPLLENTAFMGFEDGVHVNCGLGFGAEQGNRIIEGLRDIYTELHFSNTDGSLNLTPSPILGTDFLYKNGLVSNNLEQIVGNVKIYPTEYFSPKDYITGKVCITQSTYSIHHFNASWQSPHEHRVMKFRRFVGEDVFWKLVDFKHKYFNYGGKKNA